MESNWEKAIKIVLASEGGYVNNPNDLGGETNFGISKRSYPTLDIKNLTVDAAKSIYKSNYWLKFKCDQLKNGVIDILVFNLCVNAGSNGIKVLQTALGNVTVDCLIGPKTIAATNNDKNIVSKFIRSWHDYYVGLYTKNNSQIIFAKGWHRRVVDAYFSAIS